MARPLATAKQSVNLATSGPKVSRIRRDPPPPKVKELTIEERNERDRRNAVIGVLAFTFAVLVILLAVSSWAGWTPRQYHLYF
jgi:hypothetical protein